MAIMDVHVSSIGQVLLLHLFNHLQLCLVVLFSSFRPGAFLLRLAKGIQTIQILVGQPGGQADLLEVILCVDINLIQKLTIYWHRILNGNNLDPNRLLINAN